MAVLQEVAVFDSDDGGSQDATPNSSSLSPSSVGGGDDVTTHAAPPNLSTTEKQAAFELLTARLVIECDAAGMRAICYRHRSTMAEDLALFEAGSSQLDPRVKPTPHMLGLAKDYAIATGTRYNWNSPDYDRLGEIAERLGLRWGGRWKTLVDKNHVEYKER